MSRRSIGVIALVALAAVAWPATSPWAAEPAPRPGGTLTYGMVTEVSSLDPHVYVGSSWKVLNQALYSSLLTFDKQGRLTPALAESWETPNAKTFVFKLRKGVTFHKGQAFTARDVKFSLERIMDPAAGATLRANLEDAKVTVIDDFTVKIEKPKPDATLVNVLAMPEAAIVSAEWMKTNPNVKVEANGTGPFVLADYEPRVRGVMKKNPSYFEKGRPYLDSVVFRMISNDNARVNALRSGGVDMIEFVPWKDIDTLKRQPGIDVQNAGGAFMSLWSNISKPPFDNPKVRRALAFAIDREAISKAAFFGYGMALTGLPTPSDSPYYREDLAHYFSHDPKKAKALLAEAGYANGFDVDLIVYQGLSIYTTTAQIVQANLKEVGVNVRIKLMEWANVVESKDKGQYDLMVYGVNIKLPDPDVYAYYFGAESSYWAKPIGFSDPTIERLLEQGRSLTDVNGRKEVYGKLQERILELSPWIFINWREQAQAYRDKVKGYVQLGGALSESSPGISLPVMWIAK